MDGRFLERSDCKSSSPCTYDYPEQPRMLKVLNEEVTLPAPPDNNQTPGKRRKKSRRKRNNGNAEKQTNQSAANLQSTNRCDAFAQTDIVVEINDSIPPGVVEVNVLESENVPADMQANEGSIAESLQVAEVGMELQRSGEEPQTGLARIRREVKINRLLCRGQGRKTADIEQRLQQMCRAVSRHESLIQQQTDDVRQPAALIANVATKDDLERLKMWMVSKSRADGELHRTLLRNIDDLFGTRVPSLAHSVLVFGFGLSIVTVTAKLHGVMLSGASLIV